MKYLAGVRLPVAESMRRGVAGEVEALQRDGVQQRDKQDRPVWVVPVRVAMHDKARTIYVRVASLIVPVVTPGSHVSLEALSVTYWTFQGKSGITFHADAVTSVENGAA